MIISAYYINRSWRLSPCWDVANSLKEAKHKAKNWAIDSQCYTSVEDGSGKTICRYDEKGNELTPRNTKFIYNSRHFFNLILSNKNQKYFLL
jgi:hypothetical protein